MTPLNRALDALAARTGRKPRKNGAGWRSPCPAHDDRTPSLSVGVGDDGRVLLHCHAGCETSAVLAAIGLTLRDLMPDARPRHREPTLREVIHSAFPTADAALASAGFGDPTTVFAYHDTAGELVAAVARWDRPGGKEIRPVTRSADGWRLRAPAAPRPLYRLPQLLASSGPAFVAEGEKCADALAGCGLTATTSMGGAKAAGQADWTPLRGRDVVVAPDNDEPGRKYADDVARLAREAGAATVRAIDLRGHWPELPDGGDVVDLLGVLNGDAAQLRRVVEHLANAAPLVADGGAPTLVLHPAAATPTTGIDDDEFDASPAPPCERVVDQLVAMALRRYRVGISAAGEPFLVEKNGPHIAMTLTGSTRDLRASLAREFRACCGMTPSGTAISDALTGLHGEARERKREDVHLRVAKHDTDIIIDLGDASGRACVVGPGGWTVADRSPVLFRRTPLTGAMPLPTSGGSLDELRGLLNVTDETWPLLTGWMVAALIPDIPHPVAMLSGEQGTGKTTGAGLILSLVDPSPASTRAQPQDPRDWAVTASGSWAFCVDNTSALAPWWSDALCRAVTGDGWVARALYTDSDIAVMKFRRCIMLTTIDPGALRGDLADRLVLVDFERIPDKRRRLDAELQAAIDACRPRVLGALFDLLAAVLRRLPSVKLRGMPRMADFARVLAAMDAELGTDALGAFVRQRDRLADDVIEGDLVAVAVRGLLETEDVIEASAAGLLERIRPTGHALPPGWPATARALTGRLRRLVPAFRGIGIEATPPGPRERPRFWRFRRLSDGCDFQSSEQNLRPNEENRRSDGPDGWFPLSELSFEA